MCLLEDPNGSVLVLHAELLTAGLCRILRPCSLVLFDLFPVGVEASAAGPSTLLAPPPSGCSHLPSAAPQFYHQFIKKMWWDQNMNIIFRLFSSVHLHLRIQSETANNLCVFLCVFFRVCVRVIMLFVTLCNACLKWPGRLPWLPSMHPCCNYHDRLLNSIDNTSYIRWPVTTSAGVGAYTVYSSMCSNQKLVLAIIITDFKHR